MTKILNVISMVIILGSIGYTYADKIYTKRLKILKNKKDIKKLVSVAARLGCYNTLKGFDFDYVNKNPRLAKEYCIVIRGQTIEDIFNEGNIND